MADKVYKFIPLVEEAPPKESNKLKEGAATAVRTGGGMLPTALRIGTPLAAGALGMLGSPVAAIGLGAAGGSLGEYLAQMVENSGTDKKTNLGRVAVEGAIGAIPLGKAATIGRAALKGGTLATAGVAGRKYTSEDEAEKATALDPTKWGNWDAAQVAGGAVLGGVLGRGPKKPPAPPKKGPQNLNEFLEDVGWTPEQIRTQAAKMESEGSHAAAHGLRVAARDTNKGDAGIYMDITKANEKVAKVDDKNASDAFKAQIRADADARKAQKATRTESLKDWTQEARNLNARDKFLKDVEKTTDRQALQELMDREKAWIQESRNLNAAEKKLAQVRAEEFIAKRLEKLMASGAKQETVLTQTAKAENPAGGTIAATVKTFTKGKKGDAPAAAVPPVDTPPPTVPPVTPKPKATPATPAADVPVTKVPAAGEAPFNPPKMVVEEGPVPSVAPVVDEISEGGKVPTFKGSATDVLKKYQELKKAEATPEAVPTPVEVPPTPPAAAPISQPAKVEVKGNETTITGRPSAVLAAKKNLKPAPTFAESGAAGQRFAHLFKDPQDALKSRDAHLENVSKFGDEGATALDNLWGQYSTASAAGRKALRGKIFGSKTHPTEAVPTTPQAAPVAPAAIPEAPSTPLEQALLDRMAAHKAKGNVEAAPRTPDEIATLDKEGDALQLEILKREKGSGGGTPGSTVSFGGLGGGMDLLRNNPELAAKLGMTGAGAAIGAYNDEKAPLKGALVGAGAGYLGSKAFKGIDEEKMRAFGRTIPNIYRGALLSEPVGLSINTFAAPYGAGVMGSIEKLLSGKLSGDSTVASQGAKGLKNLFSPGHISRFKESVGEARTALHGVNERGEQLMGEAPNTFEKVVAFPSTAMYSGDLATRKALIEAGISDEMARAITLTANPKTELGEAIVNFAKAHPSTAFLQPFSRTAVNVVESGLERAPVVGLMWNAIRNPRDRQAISDIIAQQGMGVGVSALAYYAGENIDPETAKQYQLAKLISNMGGQYSAVTGAAFAAGQAAQVGKPRGKAIINSATRELPLPETGGVVDTATSIYNLAGGEPAHPEKTHLPERWLPKAFTPGIVRDSTIDWAQDLMGRRRRSYNFTPLPE